MIYLKGGQYVVVVSFQLASLALVLFLALIFVVLLLLGKCTTFKDVERVLEFTVLAGVILFVVLGVFSTSSALGAVSSIDTVCIESLDIHKIDKEDDLLLVYLDDESSLRYPNRPLVIQYDRFPTKRSLVPNNENFENAVVVNEVTTVWENSLFGIIIRTELTSSETVIYVDNDLAITFAENDITLWQEDN